MHFTSNDPTAQLIAESLREHCEAEEASCGCSFTQTASGVLFELDPSCETGIHLQASITYRSRVVADSNLNDEPKTIGTGDKPETIDDSNTRDWNMAQYHLQAYRRLRRSTWPPGYYVVRHRGIDLIPGNVHPGEVYVYVPRVDGTVQIMIWLPSLGDQFATDWTALGLPELDPTS